MRPPGTRSMARKGWCRPRVLTICAGSTGPSSGTTRHPTGTGLWRSPPLSSGRAAIGASGRLRTREPLPPRSWMPWLRFVTALLTRTRLKSPRLCGDRDADTDWQDLHPFTPRHECPERVAPVRRPHDERPGRPAVGRRAVPVVIPDGCRELGGATQEHASGNHGDEELEERAPALDPPPSLDRSPGVERPWHPLMSPPPRHSDPPPTRGSSVVRPR